MKDKEGPGPQGFPWWGIGVYLAVGGLWVFGGEALLQRWWGGAAQMASYQLWKTELFFLISSVLVAWLLLRVQTSRRQHWATAQELDQVVRHAPAGIARVAVTGRVLWVNARLCRVLGLDAARIAELNFRDVVEAPDADWAAGQMQRLLAGQIDHYIGEYRCRRQPDGQIVPLLGTTTLVPAAKDSPEHLLCVLQDMSEIRAARTALERSEMRLRLALDGSGGGVWDWDIAHRRFAFTQSVERLLHYEGSDLPADFDLESRLHPEDRQRAIAAVKHSITTGAPFSESMRILGFDHQYRWYAARGQRHLDAQGRPERFSGIITDQSDQRRAEARQRLAATVVDNTIEGVVVTDAQSHILSVNASFTRLLGYTEDELWGKTPRLFKSGRHDQAFYAAMWERLNTTGHWQGEIWNKRKNGEVFPEHMSLSSVRDALGQVTHYVCMFTDISEEKAQHQRLEFLAHNDPLTELANRLAFSQALEAAVVDAEHHGEHLGVLLLNLDRFKDVNDSYGHAIGDQVLKHIARRVEAALRPGDLLGRIAGDELAVLARSLPRTDDAADYARDLIAAVAEPWRSPEGFEVVAGVSVGICLYPDHMGTAQQLLQGAHAAVYGAKARGRGAWCFFNQRMTESARERLALESRLRLALARGHLKLYYQPQVDIATGRVIGAEGLLRWTDPEEGPIAPARFIPVAEASGVIGPLGEWVMREVCRQGQVWRDAGLPDVTLAVNVSPRQFHLTDLVGCAAAALKDSGFPATRLELELTESALAERPEEARQVLLRLRALGVRMAVDDFGTGYSSLAHLKRFPIDVLKIDQGFIRDVPQNADDMAICSAIIAMGHSLGLAVLAEGVETDAQYRFLQERGCDRYQGYLCDRPLPASEFTVLLQTQAALGG